MAPAAEVMEAVQVSNHSVTRCLTPSSDVQAVQQVVLPVCPLPAGVMAAVRVPPAAQVRVAHPCLAELSSLAVAQHGRAFVTLADRQNRQQH